MFYTIYKHFVFVLLFIFELYFIKNIHLKRTFIRLLGEERSAKIFEIQNRIILDF